jgi:predicted DsbA family dithiol-disulfide isomerase
MKDIPRITVEIWSDISCPWCYIGKARFARALAAFPQRSQVDVIHRSFELDPGLSHTAATTSPEHAQKYGMTPAQARAAEENLAALAREEGLAYAVEGRDHGNTFDLHRLLHLAGAHGRRDELLDALYAANFASKSSVYDAARQTELAIGVGLDADEVQAVLADPTAYADDVRAEEADAAALGITGVPFFVVDRTYGISGAQPTEVFSEALMRSWTDKAPKLTALGDSADGACGPDGACELPGSGPAAA